MDEDVEYGSTAIVMDCGIDNQPQQWHLEIVNKSDSISYYYCEGNSLNVHQELASILVYNADMENIEVLYDSMKKTTIARTVSIDDNSQYDGQRIVYMPDKVFSEYLQVKSSKMIPMITLVPQSRICSYDIRITIITENIDIIGCKTALIGGMAESLNLITLTPSTESVAMSIPLWMEDKVRNGDNVENVVYGQIRTLGRAQSDDDNVLFLTLILSNGKTLNLYINVTNDIQWQETGGRINKTINISNLPIEDGDDTIVVEGMDEENDHIIL
ncbi:MAG: DUF5119 domain-containing protein [Prevotella sp.]